MPDEMSSTDTLNEEMLAIVARYPRPRSALMPMLHLVQSSRATCPTRASSRWPRSAGVTPAEANAVASFYTMYVREPQGRHHIGVCTNTLCAILGGDALWSALSEHVGIGHGETTA